MSAPTPVRLQTSVWNPLGARRALLLHGLGADASTWWRVAAALADDGFLVLAPDLRSHGRSPSAVDHSLAAFAKDVLLLGEGYDLIIAHSLGGALAAHLLTRQGFADAAVLLDPVLRVEQEARDSLRSALRADVGHLDPAVLRAENPRWGERDLELKVLAAARVTPSVVDAVFAHNDPWDLMSNVPSWNARVHVLGADPMVGALVDLDELADAAGEATTVELVAGAGHAIHREQPDVVLAAVERVLAG